MLVVIDTILLKISDIFRRKKKTSYLFDFMSRYISVNLNTDDVLDDQMTGPPAGHLAE